MPLINKRLWIFENKKKISWILSEFRRYVTRKKVISYVLENFTIKLSYKINSEIKKNKAVTFARTH